VIGTVATLPYGPFAWIAMVLVDPKARGRGVGTLLLHRGVALVPKGAAARLDATPAGEALYRQLGFVAEYGLARWFLDASASRLVHASGARRFERSDWPAVRALDLRAFGASRVGLLERLAEEAPQYAWVLEGNRGGLRGFLFGRHGHVREHLGPLVADSHESARLLLESCLASQPDRAVFIDVPALGPDLDFSSLSKNRDLTPVDDHAAWRDALSLAGFTVERPFVRMYRGQLTARGDPSLSFAICGPEFG